MLAFVLSSLLDTLPHWFCTVVDFFASIGPSLIANSIGALVGAVLAIPTGLWLDRRIKLREQRERTTMVLQAVRDELNKNRKALEEFLVKEPKEDEIIYPTLTNSAWQAAQSLEVLSTSGDYELHKTLLGTYESMDFVTQVAQSLWNLFFSVSHDFGTLDRKVKVLTRLLKEVSQNTLPIIEETLIDVQKRLKK